MFGDWAPVKEWHRAVNEQDQAAARAVSTDTVRLGGPRGEVAGVNSLLEWISRAGIHLVPVAWHPVDGTRVVVEQEASWPRHPEAAGAGEPVRTATLFELEGGRVAAALRFDTLAEALAAAAGS